jgi:hypothetical protein
LNHNSAGDDLSTVIYAPDGIPVNFTTNLGNITSISYTNKGEAEATLNLTNIQSGINTVSANIDKQNSTTSVDKTAKAVISITSDAVDPNSVHWVLNWSNYYELELAISEYFGISMEEYCYIQYGDPYAYLNHNLMPELYDHYYNTLTLTYELPLNESVSWVSVLYKSTSPDFGTFTNEVDLIVNGVVVQSRIVTNYNYLNLKDSFSERYGTM